MEHAALAWPLAWSCRACCLPCCSCSIRTGLPPQEAEQLAGEPRNGQQGEGAAVATQLRAAMLHMASAGHARDCMGQACKAAGSALELSYALAVAVASRPLAVAGRSPHTTPSLPPAIRSTALQPHVILHCRLLQQGHHAAWSSWLTTGATFCRPVRGSRAARSAFGWARQTQRRHGGPRCD